METVDTMKRLCARCGEVVQIVASPTIAFLVAVGKLSVPQRVLCEKCEQDD